MERNTIERRDAFMTLGSIMQNESAIPRSSARQVQDFRLFQMWRLWCSIQRDTGWIQEWLQPINGVCEPEMQ